MAAISRTEASTGSPDVIVTVMSKLLEDLVSRNDQVEGHSQRRQRAASARALARDSA
jgi:hypothetical protein